MNKYKNILFMVLAVLLVLAPNLYYLFVGKEIQSPLRQIGFLAFSTSLLLIPIFFFTKRIRLYFIILLPFVSLAPLEMFFLYLYKYPITAGMLGTVLATNVHESLEFISGVITTGVISLVLIIPFTLLYLYFIKKMDKSLNVKVTLIISVLFSFYLGMVYFIPPEKEFKKERMTNLERLRKFETRVLKTYPFGVVLNFVTYLRESEFIRNRQELFIKNPVYAEKREEVKEREIYVFILGEAVRYQNFSINNYDRETTPHLRSIDNFVSYSDICSSATETRTSIPLLMTKADPCYYPTAFTLPSILTVFKKAGFESYWISNQNKADINNKTIMVFVNEADHVIYLNEAKMFNEEEFEYDGALIPALNDVLTKSNARKIFVILHTMGCHYRYDFRYPPEFDVFKPSMKGMTDVRVDDPSTREIKINSYDNAILYTDYVISSIIKAVSS